MSVILDRCPFFQEATEVESGTGKVHVKAYQIIVWVSISVRDSLSQAFPAILDTGHSHNFSIREEQLQQWAGLQSSDLQTVGFVRVNKQLLELKSASVAIHSNLPGKRDEFRRESPFVLRLKEGIAVHRIGDRSAPRLPLLGVRALVRNGLTVVINGGRQEVSLEHSAM